LTPEDVLLEDEDLDEEGEPDVQWYPEEMVLDVVRNVLGEERARGVAEELARLAADDADGEGEETEA